MSERTKLPNGVRFEVFKRDKFTCQYCGQKAPDVVLEVDHIKPVSAGGTNDLLNLTTSCWACNNGKSDKALSDDSAVAKARTQADAMEERRQQVQMMADWQIELARMDTETMAIDEAFSRIAGRRLTDQGKREMRQAVREFGLQEVIAAIAIAYDRYGAEDAYGKVTGICAVRKRERDDPLGAAAHRIWYKMRGSFYSTKPWVAKQIVGCLRTLLQRGETEAGLSSRIVTERFRNPNDLAAWLEGQAMDGEELF